MFYSLPEVVEIWPYTTNSPVTHLLQCPWHLYLQFLRMPILKHKLSFKKKVAMEIYNCCDLCFWSQKSDKKRIWYLDFTSWDKLSFTESCGQDPAGAEHCRRAQMLRKANAGLRWVKLVKGSTLSSLSVDLDFYHDFFKKVKASLPSFFF